MSNEELVQSNGLRWLPYIAYSLGIAYYVLGLIKENGSVLIALVPVVPGVLIVASTMAALKNRRGLAHWFVCAAAAIQVVVYLASPDANLRIQTFNLIMVMAIFISEIRG